MNFRLGHEIMRPNVRYVTRIVEVKRNSEVMSRSFVVAGL